MHSCWCTAPRDPRYNFRARPQGESAGQLTLTVIRNFRILAVGNLFESVNNSQRNWSGEISFTLTWARAGFRERKCQEELPIAGSAFLASASFAGLILNRRSSPTSPRPSSRPSGTPAGSRTTCTTSRTACRSGWRRFRGRCGRGLSEKLRQIVARATQTTTIDSQHEGCAKQRKVWKRMQVRREQTASLIECK